MGKDPSAITASREAFYAADPIDRVLALFDLGWNHAGKPFVPTHKQVESVNLYGHVNGHGCWGRPGTGKTLTMTLHALLAMCEGTHKQCVMPTPPAVIPTGANSCAASRSAPQASL